MIIPFFPEAINKLLAENKIEVERHFGGDDLASEEWNSRGRNTRQGIRYNLVMLCLELENSFN